MYHKDNTLFVAYLLFIFISIMLKFFNVFDSIPSFNTFFHQLVIGVTVSSYFFTFADIYMSNNERNNYKHYKLDDIAKEIITISETYINILKKKGSLTENEQELMKKLSNERDHQKKEILNKKDKKTHPVAATIMNILGFIIVLSCLAFQEISVFFAKQQEICTITAFFFMLLDSYINNWLDHLVDKEASANQIKLKDLRLLCSNIEV